MSARPDPSIVALIDQGAAAIAGQAALAKALFDAFIAVGFTEAQALTLTVTRVTPFWTAEANDQ